MTDEVRGKPQRAWEETDHRHWVEEIDQWQTEHQRALATLDAVAAFIQEHDAELKTHLHDIEAHRERCRNGGSGVEELSAHHAAVKDRHLRYRGRHRGLIDEVSRLNVEFRKVTHRLHR